MSRIKELRIKKGLKQVDLSKMLNIAQNTLSYWESGKTEPGGEALTKLADILSTTTDRLLDRDTLKMEVQQTAQVGVKINVLGAIPAGIAIEL